MNEHKTGGPAFPVPGWPDDPNFNGMTLRDYFAAKAMQGLLANPGGPIQANGRSGWSFTNCEKNEVAELAYIISDAMLKARQA